MCFTELFLNTVLSKLAINKPCWWFEVLNRQVLLHYQKVIVALTETERLMGEIDAVFLIEK